MNYFLRTVPEVSGEGLSTTKKLQATVNNTGNYFFEHALSRQVKDCVEISKLSDLPLGSERLILSMSNFLSPATDLGWFADEIEARAPKQIVMVGAGAQAAGFSDSIELKPGTRRFVDLLADRGITIGVRGQYTASVLADIGIHNVDVIGCPSLFYHCDRGFQIAKKDLGGKKPKAVVHCTPSGHYRDAVSHLLSFAVRECVSYVAQSEAHLIFEDVEMEDRRKYFFNYYNDGTYSSDQLHDWMRRNIKWFFDLKTWFAYMSSVDIAIGSRFHGNMAALQVGVPALNLVFDTRTRELCEHLNLPYEFLKTFDGKRSAQEIYDQLDYSLFNATFPGKFDVYSEFLSRNGVPSRLERGELPSEETQSGRVRLATVVDLLNSCSTAAVSSERVVREVMLRIEQDRGAYLRKMAEGGKFDLRNENA